MEGSVGLVGDVSKMSNASAFLTMISVSEGTAGIGDNGYNVMVGSTPAHPILFDDYSDHPRIYNPHANSTAAGRYQLLARWFDAYKLILNLPDFSPASQDAIAIRQITERGAWGDVQAGNFDTAVRKVSNIWASLPGSPYGQHTNDIGMLRKAYTDAGGTLV